MHKLVIIVLGSLLFLLAACGEEEVSPSTTATREGTPSAEATAIPEITPTLTAEAAVSPTPEVVVCAADSTERFLEAQERVPFPVLCPTFLPEGFELEEVRVALEGLLAWVDATFKNPEEEASVTLTQGNLGASLPASFVRLAGQQGVLPETTAFGNLEGTLYAPLTRPPAGTQNPFSADVSLGAGIIAVPANGPPPGYALLTEEVDVDTVKDIAAAMRAVSPAPEVTPSPTAQAVVSQTPDAIACAADSTEAFVDAQEEAPFTVYCPTFLPAGLTLEDVGYSPEDVTHGPTVGGAFANSALGVRVEFVQGEALPLSLLTTGVRFGGGGPSGTMIPYGDFLAELWLPGEPGMALAVLGESPDGVTHWMVAQGLTEDELREIAASLRPVSPTR
jgi:hypothetical protein